MSQVTTPTEPGWLPDPSGRYEWRYWDGGWTNRVANTAPAPEPIPAPEPAPVPAAAPAPAPTPVAMPTPAPAVPAAAEIETPAAPITARDAVPRAPFGTDPAPAADAAPAAAPQKQRRTPWAALMTFFRSFGDQPESYHSRLARDPLPPDARGENLVRTGPGNYGHAMIVSLAAVGIVVGAYLPWISGTIGLAHFQKSGFDDGLGG